MRKMASMAFLFEEAVAFNQPIGQRDTSMVSKLYGIFNHAISFNQPLNQWNINHNVAEDDEDYGHK
ncbi:BspA family leucine-rich repeat surface protein [archaeon]|nr:MAG: BspA family leucine-rich repeat surface protein [archaeon]